MSLERVLVVDDNQRWRDFFRRTLEAQAYAVTCAEDFDAAMQELRSHFYPVVVVDVRLLGHEDTEGLHLIHEMDRLWPTDAIQKIIVSGQDLKADETQQVTQATKGKTVSFCSKGGDDGAGFDHLRFLSIVWLAFARLQRPNRCFFSGKECGEDIELQADKIFVAMPYSIKSPGITINMDEMYDLGVRPALRELGYDAVRADKTPFAGGLMCNICKNVQGSVMCVADITDWNPNVLFELGLMYGLGKTAIILKHAKCEVPTDLKFALFIEYDGLRSLKSRLKQLLKGLQQSGSSVAPLEKTVTLSPKMTQKRQSPTQLRQLLTMHFDEGELRTLCFELGIEYDDLAGGNRADKTRELVKYLERRGRLSGLIETGKGLRPEISWPNIP